MKPAGEFNRRVSLIGVGGTNTPAGWVAQETAMPVALINARLSERSFRRYRRWQRWLPIAWEALTLIAAQTADDAERFRELGAKHVVVTGNLKFDQTPNPELVALGKSWQRHLGNRAALVWASTRDGEEKLLLDAWERLLETFPPQWRAPLLVIVRVQVLTFTVN